MASQSEIKKQLRFDVLNKCNSKCAYCGCNLIGLLFHMDHVIPKRRYVSKVVWEGMEVGNDNIENLLPSCQSCNLAKNDISLEDFRLLISNRVNRLEESSSTYRMAKKFGLVVEIEKPIIFYFETLTHNG